MATLSKPTAPRVFTSAAPSEIAHNVPAPFSEADFQRIQDSRDEESCKAPAMQEPIAHVQRTCLMTLNNLLEFDPIVPDRRHSMPHAPQSAIQPTSSALQTLVSNLRSRDTDSQATKEAIQSQTDTELIRELSDRVEKLTFTLHETDAQLARAVVSLLAHFNRVREIYAISNGTSLTPIDAPPADVFATLKRQLSDFQHERPEATGAASTVVEAALLWSQIDDELETVVAMCRERNHHHPLPPQYNTDDYEPPEYEGRGYVEDDKHSEKQGTETLSNEKMRLDLEAVTMAIDRLYLVAPQLHNQRVELKTSKLEQMERARLTNLTVAQGKQREKDQEVRELENILELLGKASERGMSNQSVVIEGGMQARLERSRMQEIKKREAFVDSLVQHSSSGRIHDQTATLQKGPRERNPEAMITLPEFMRESMPKTNPRGLMTLPEFLSTTGPEPAPVPTVSRLKEKESRHRSRSLSAPSMSWLRPSSKSAMLETSTVTRSSSAVAFEVSYVAENHENLQHVSVFLSVTGASDAPVEVEVLDTLPEGTGAGQYLVVKNGINSSAPLMLPARTTPGKKTITQVQGGHYEVKLSSIPSSLPRDDSADSTPLLDATQLTDSNPTSFICSSCSLPLVQSAKIERYRDLPSEHWEELVEAWMCHADQKLNEEVAKHGRGFWPDKGQALVGGSYVLFNAEEVVSGNLLPAEKCKRGEEWRLVRCLCGSVAGRCQEHAAAIGLPSTTIYRLLKFAIRHVGGTIEQAKIPLSAFVVEDMMEFVSAHATYRFVISDEEAEKPRILIWLFKPSIRLSYTTPTQYAMPKSGSISAAKVLYKTLGPASVAGDLKTILNQYPGFPQAEYLFYPMDVCRRLATLTRESNSAYPESMRTMTGLDVGFLGRV